MLDEPRTMPSIFHGRIVHRFHLPRPGTKRREKKINATNNSGNSCRDEKDEGSKDQRKRCHNDCGFVFIPESKKGPHHEYLLSFPKRLLKLACDAARLERKVAIKRYTEIPFLKSSEASEYGQSRVSASFSSSLSTGYSMIEVHDMELIQPKFPDTAKTKKKLWTLTQFWRKEQLDFQKMKNSRPKFSLVATVDAISPIVALDPSNPFALIEVYDVENTDVTCVVVLHGKQAVVNHEAVHPLDTLVFRDVVYKPWSVHKMLRDNKCDKDSATSTFFSRFIGRVPSHVFVATQADSVSWGNENKTSTLGNTCPSSRIGSPSDRDQNRIPPLITPLNLVSTITGEIHDVQTLSVSSGHSEATVIHYLDMILLNQSTCGHSGNRGGNAINSEQTTSEGRCRLYLFHFPMSVALQCSLRSGGIVQAYNVHLICSQGGSHLALDVDDKIVTSYGACLRSTLILLKHASEVTASSVESRTQTMDLDPRDESIASFSTQPCEKSHVSLRKGSLISHHRRLNRQSWGGIGSDIALRGKVYQSIRCPMKFINYGFRKIKQTYVEDLHFEHVKGWECRSFRGSSHSMDLIERHVPRAWVVRVLLNSSRGTEDETNACPGNGDQPTSSVPQKANQPTSIRSPYAEFFDHSFSVRANDNQSNIEGPACSCHLSVEDRKNPSLRPSMLLGLNEIRVESQRYFENHIVDLLQSSATSQDAKQLYQLRKGFHGSIRVPLPKLHGKHSKENYTRRESDDESNEVYFVGGFVSEVHSPNSSVASIVDGVCQTPITFNRDNRGANINDFCMGELDSVMISCLCLGNVAAENGRDHTNKNVSVSDLLTSEAKSVSLPVINSRENDLLSNCTLVTIDGFLFITTIQLHCMDLKLQEVTSALKAQEEVGLEEVTLTVEECLTTNNWLSKPSKSDYGMGMLTRCRFHSKVNNDGTYKCCCLTVSSYTRKESVDIEWDDSCLQALELTVSIVQSTGRLAKFNEILSACWPKANLIGSQKILASSFWVLGNSGRTCAMTFGGSEDIVPGSSCSKSRIMITFPISSMQLSKLGYTRSFCSHDCLDAFFENWHSSDDDAEPCDTISKHAIVQPFDFMGGTIMPPGMLHRRPSRRTYFRSDVPPLRTIGELSTTCSNAIPLNTLSDLFELIFQGLRETNSSQSIMNPSLVRRISNGRFLGVSFCQVQCYCTRCFCPLISSPSTLANDATKVRKRARNDSFDEPSFWHLPHPVECLPGTNRIRRFTSAVTDKSTLTLPRHIRSCRFRCPKNNCSKHMFGVKWECSGVLDDGTGQATMYADGDAALTLLGMSAEAIQIIEEGVWSTQDGSIQFMKSIPPPKDLRQKVVDILATQRGDGYKKPTVDPLALLSMEDRASYLFERHCRSSNRPHRPLDYYVRCKPLRNKENSIPHLRHTTIDSFFEESANENGSSSIYRGQVASYTIPSLKLELVDCGVKSLGSLCRYFE